MTELKPCPFCGGEAKVRKKWGHWTVYCLDCCASSDRYVPGGTYYESCETKDDAVERWNTRAEQTCRYEPDGKGFIWWDENDVEHYEEYSASDDCWSASCDICGYTMMVGDEGWFRGWDDIKVWNEEDGSEHHGILLEPIFKFCPNCGRKVEQ